MPAWSVGRRWRSKIGGSEMGRWGVPYSLGPGGSKRVPLGNEGEGPKRREELGYGAAVGLESMHQRALSYYLWLCLR